DHLDTVSGIVSKWAPPSENDTAGYIAGVSHDTGFAPNQRINLHDPAVMRKFVAAMIKRETHAAPAAQIAAGVNMVLPEAAPANVAAAAAPPANVAGGAGA